LRQRREDIPALVKHFVSRLNAEENKRIIGAAPSTLALLSAFDWPGNVRQLENALFRAVVLCDGEFLQPEDFPQISGLPLRPIADASAPAPAPANDLPTSSVAPRAANDTDDDDALVAIVEAELVPPPGVAVFDPAGHLRTLEAIERDLIDYAIDLYAGHMTEIAKRLGIGRSTLYRKLKEYGLEERAAQIG
jgi:DNA-binding NtrC family response regulator